MARTTKTNERMIVDILVAGYDKKDVKIKSKIDDDKSVSIVVNVSPTSIGQKFGIFKSLGGFKETIPVDKNIYDVDKLTAEVYNGYLQISIPKKDEFISKTLVDFGTPAPADNATADAAPTQE